MKLLEVLKHEISGAPRLTRNGQGFRLTARHRKPSSGDEVVTAHRMIGGVVAVATLVAYYRPETSAPVKNVLVDIGNTVVGGLLNAADRLAEVVRQHSLDVPLESLRGWGVATAFVVGTSLFLRSPLFDVYTFLTNREDVKIDVDREHLTLRRGVFLPPKRIARERIQDVLILKNHKAGHDVMLQHEGGLMRLASIFGDMTRPTLFRLRLKEALAESVPRSPAERLLRSVGKTEMNAGSQ